MLDLKSLISCNFLTDTWVCSFAAVLFFGVVLFFFVFSVFFDPRGNCGWRKHEQNTAPKNSAAAKVEICTWSAYNSLIWRFFSTFFFPQPYAALETYKSSPLNALEKYGPRSDLEEWWSSSVEYTGDGGWGGGGGGRCPAPEKGCLLMFAAFERIVNIVILVLWKASQN